MKRTLLLLLLFLIASVEIFSDKVELKSGQVYNNVLTIVEPNSLLIYSEDGQKDEVPKSELKRITLEIVSWKNRDSSGNKDEKKDSDSSKLNPVTEINSPKPATNIDKPQNENLTNISESKAESKSPVLTDKDKGIYAQVSTVAWQVGGMENLIGMQSSRLLNGIFLRNTGLAWTSFPIIRLSDDTINVKGQAFDFGYSFGKNTNYPAKLQLRLIRSSPSNFTSLNIWEYSNPSLIFSTREIEIYKFDSNRRSIFSYEQKYFFNEKADTLRYSRFGVQGGINAQFDSIKGTLTSIGSGNGVNQAGIVETQGSVPIAAKTNYSEKSFFLSLGGVYTLNTFVNQELEFGASLYKGISIGEVNYNSISVYPIANGTKKTFSSNLNGIGYNLSYIFKLSEIWNLKLAFDNRILTYEIKTIKTLNFGFELGQDLGPLFLYKDRLTSLGISMEYKF